MRDSGIEDWGNEPPKDGRDTSINNTPAPDENNKLSPGAIRAIQGLPPLTKTSEPRTPKIDDPSPLERNLSTDAIRPIQGGGPQSNTTSSSQEPK